MSLRTFSDRMLGRMHGFGRAARAAVDHPVADKLRRVMLPLALVAGFCFFGFIVNQKYPIKDWLFLRYAKSWALALFWFSGCVSTGYALVRRLGPRLPLSERLVLACAAGIYASYVLMFLGGIVGLYRFAAFSVLLPAVMNAIGARPLLLAIRRAWRHAQSARRLVPPRISLVGTVIGAFGTIYLALIYIGILTPDNASFDAIYYHLGIASQNHELGGIYRTPEGWIVDGLPLLASVNYTWGFIFPTNDLFDAMMVCAHMEFVIFVATLVSLPVLVRYLVPRARAWGAWTAMFLFPAILVYDAGLHSANDHITAFWAVPIWLAFRRSWRRLEPGCMALFAISASGALMTKYQAAGLLIVPTLALIGRGLVLGVRKSGAPWGRGLATALGVGIVITAPHWLKNWIWYGDPLFPALYEYLELRPFHAHATEALDQTARLSARPHGTFWEQVGQIWRGAIQFPFRTRERPDFHKDWPVFGPLFHLSILWLPFLTKTRRTWTLFAATFVALLFWYFFNHFERYLQPMIPWMAAVAAATIVLMWQRGRLTKLAVLGMVGLEVVWGADVYFFPHLMLKEAPIRASADLINSGFRGDLGRRQNFLRPLKQIGESLPPDAKVLLHEHCPRLGLGAPVVMDFPGFQTGIAYQDMQSAREVYDLYVELGVTHIVYVNGYANYMNNLANDLRFWEFVTNWATNHKHFGGLVVAEMPKSPPDSTRNDQVAYLSCDPNYTAGMYSLPALNIWPHRGGTIPAAIPAPTGKRKLNEFVARANFLVTASVCKDLNLPKSIFRGFTRVAGRAKEDLWIRRRAAPKPTVSGTP